MLEPGTVIDRKYRILRVIGIGGMSIVYLAVNDRANKHWAVKEVRRDGIQDFTLVRRSLMAEMDILKKLRHPSLPRIVDVIDTEDSFLIIMDYIHGRTLESLLKISGPRPAGQVMDWALQLVRVLDYLHSREPPVIYRDLKPSNIMLKPDGDITLIDFGTAREMKEEGRRDTTCLGTRGFAAPEQYLGRGQTDARTDIYCLGVTLYVLLTGHNPGEPPYELQPLRHWIPHVSEGLEQIISRCTMSDPAKRYQTCHELLDDLQAEMRGKAKGKQGKKRPTVSFLLILLAALLTVSGGSGYMIRRLHYKNNLERAEQAKDLRELEHWISRAEALDRGNPEAYQTMLVWMVSDNLFTDQEKTLLESFLYEKRKLIPTITLMRWHRRRYARFSYDMGLACFFYYNGSRGKEIAARWFSGLSGSSLSKEEKTRAEIYKRIGSYYSSLSREDRSGERDHANYQTFFSDLTALNSFTPARIGNGQAAITLYCEICRQLGDHAGDFMREEKGPSASQLNRELLRIEGYIKDESLESADRQEIRKLQANIEDARCKIQAAAGSGAASGQGVAGYEKEEKNREKTGSQEGYDINMYTDTPAALLRHWTSMD